MRIYNYIRIVINSIIQRGIINTLSFVFDDFIFSLKYGVDTGGIINLNKFTIKGDNAQAWSPIIRQ